MLENSCRLSLLHRAPPPPMPTTPVWGQSRGLPSYYPGLQALGSHVHLSPTWTRGQMKLASVTSGPTGRPQKFRVLSLNPHLAPKDEAQPRQIGQDRLSIGSLGHMAKTLGQGLPSALQPGSVVVAHPPVL